MSRKLTGRVDEREVHRGGNNGFGKSSEERFDHVADCIDIRGAINACMSCDQESIGEESLTGGPNQPWFSASLIPLISKVDPAIRSDKVSQDRDRS